MNRLSVGIVAGVLLIGLVGCSSTATKLEACAGATKAVEKATDALGSGADALDVVKERAEVAKAYVAELRGVEGPAEFLPIRDALADSYDGLLENVMSDGSNGSAGAAVAKVTGPLTDLTYYCSGK